MPDILFWDIETRSTVDLRKTGPFVYAEDPMTDVIVACYAFNDEGVETWWAGDPCPERIRTHIEGGGKWVAHNALFEFTLCENVLAKRYGWPVFPFENAIDTAASAASMALPRSLDGVGGVLGLDQQKDADGHRLMLRMCKPRKVNPDGSVVWWTDADRMSRLRDYCALDVEVEWQVYKRLPWLNETEQKVYALDGAMNRRGVRVDIELVKAARDMALRVVKQLDRDLAEATNYEVGKTSKVLDLMQWLSKHYGIETDTVDKHFVRRQLEDPNLPPQVRRVLEIRREAAKTSTSKYKSFLDRTSSDNRIRDTLMYHGASTGRWSGKGVQLHNLPRPSTAAAALEYARQIVLKGDLPALLFLFESPMAVLSDLIRSCIIATPGRQLYVADYAAIEARVLAWLAGQLDLLKLFAAGEDVYLDMASAIYRIPAASMNKKTHPDERQLGKTAILGLGFGMGSVKFKDTCELQSIPITGDKAEEVKNIYRTKNNKIVQFWYDLEAAARACVNGGLGTIKRVGYIRYEMKKGFLVCHLPSGRTLWYAAPRIGLFKRDDWDEPKENCLTFMGVNSVTRKWERQDTYGGKLCENVTQAVARDLLAEGMLRVEDAGYEMICSVHDELISEADMEHGSVEEFEGLMSTLPDWAKGCPVAAEGYRAERYRK